MVVDQMIFKTKPFEKQLEAFELSKDRKEFAFFMEMGTGKSKVLIDNISYLYFKGEINAVVILALKGCYLNWNNEEFPKHMPDEINRKIVIWKSPSSQSYELKQDLKKFLTTEFEGIKILLVNTEALSSDDATNYLLDFVQSHKALVAIDESTSIRTVSSKRCMHARKIGKYAAYKRILTGTPIANKPLDIFGQCAFLNIDLLGFPTYQAFKHFYADIVMVPLGPRKPYPKIMGYRRLEHLTKSLKGFSYRVLKQDCFDLPEKVYIKRYIEPTKEQAKMYNEMSKSFVAQASSGQVSTAPLAITKMMRLHSILCGHLKMDTGEIVDIPSNRVNTLVEMLQEINGKAIIWCSYQRDIENISKALEKEFGRDSYVTYFGNTTESQRQEALHKFKNMSECQFFIGTPQTGGKGLTLVEANTVIYFSQGYDLEYRLQSEDRAHRIGQKNKVTYIDMLVLNSIDHKIYNALMKKQNLAESILHELKSVFEPISI